MLAIGFVENSSIPETDPGVGVKCIFLKIIIMGFATDGNDLTKYYYCLPDPYRHIEFSWWSNAIITWHTVAERLGSRVFLFAFHGQTGEPNPKTIAYILLYMLTKIHFAPPATNTRRPQQRESQPKRSARALAKLERARGELCVQGAQTHRFASLLSLALLVRPRSADRQGHIAANTRARGELLTLQARRPFSSHCGDVVVDVVFSPQSGEKSLTSRARVRCTRVKKEGCSLKQKFRAHRENNEMWSYYVWKTYVVSFCTEMKAYDDYLLNTYDK